MVAGIEVSGVSLAGTKPTFLQNLFAALRAVGAKAVEFTSLKRDPGPGNDVANSNHITGDAGDGYAIINGRRVPLGTAVKPVASRFGLRSGDVAGFDPRTPGGYDPVHVDDGANVNAGRPLSRSRAAGGSVYGNAELQNLWNAAGGDPALAETMAAIALAESSGDPQARNVNVDGSIDRGLWQINSSNFDSDTLTDPRVNASWAVKIEKSQGLRAWVTYKNDAYKIYLDGTTQPSVTRTRPDGSGESGGGALAWMGAFAGGPSTLAEKTFTTLFGGGIGGLADVFKGAIWLMNPRSWLRMVEFVAGMTMMLFGFIGLAVMFVQRSGVVGEAANIAQVLPGPVGAAGKAVTVVRAPGAAARRRVTESERQQRQQQQADELAGRRRAREEHVRRLGEIRQQSARSSALSRTARRAPARRDLS